MSFQLVRKSVTLNDVERRNGRYFAWFQRIPVASGAHCVKVDVRYLISWWVLVSLTLVMRFCFYAHASKYKQVNDLCSANIIKAPTCLTKIQIIWSFTRATVSFWLPYHEFKERGPDWLRQRPSGTGNSNMAAQNGRCRRAAITLGIGPHF